MAAEWVEEERGETDFGDARLAKRFTRLLSDMYERSRNSIPAACGGWAETIAAYRFFNHPNVDLKQVLSGHYQSTVNRIKDRDVVLIPQDTTQLIRDITQKTDAIKGIRAIRKDKTFLHANIAFTEQRVCLGVVAVDHWKRAGKKNPKIQAQKPIEDKESIRWLQGYETTCAVQAQCPKTLVVSIADREGDLYELFLQAQSYPAETQAGWIVRSKHNRPVVDETNSKLRSYLGNSPVKGHSEFTLPANGERASRQVKQTIQAARVPLTTTAHSAGKFEDIEVNAILVKEHKPPKGEKPIEWVLLTNLPIETEEQVKTIIQWYVCRWEIEIYFRVLKNGCQVQKLQLETIERFEACLGIYLIIAWRLLFMTMIARKCPNIGCDTVLDQDEWQSLYITVKQEPPPKTPPSLNMAIDMIAKLGGYLGRTNDGPAGTKTVWIGLQRLRDFTLAINGYKKAVEEHRTYV